MKTLVLLLVTFGSVHLQAADGRINFEKVSRLDNSQFISVCNKILTREIVPPNRFQTFYHLTGEILRRGNPDHLKIAEGIWEQTGQERQFYFNDSFIPAARALPFESPNPDLSLKNYSFRVKQLVHGLALFIHRNKLGRSFKDEKIDNAQWVVPWYNIPNEPADSFDEQQRALALKHDLVLTNNRWLTKEGKRSDIFETEGIELRDQYTKTLKKFAGEILNTLVSFNPDKVKDVYAYHYMVANMNNSEDWKVIKPAIVKSPALMRLYYQSRCPEGWQEESLKLGLEDKSMTCMETYLAHLYGAGVENDEFNRNQAVYETFLEYQKKIEASQKPLILWRYCVFQKKRYRALWKQSRQKDMLAYNRLKTFYAKQVSLLKKLDLKTVSTQEVFSEVFPVYDINRTSALAVLSFIKRVPKAELYKAQMTSAGPVVFFPAQLSAAEKKLSLLMIEKVLAHYGKNEEGYTLRWWEQAGNRLK